MRSVVVGLVLWAGLPGCANWNLGYTLHRFQGQLLHARTGPGAEALEIQRDVDPEVRSVCEQRGPPDYVLIEDQFATQLIYVEDDTVIRFQRSITNRLGTPTETRGVPDGLLRLLPASDRQRITEKRAKGNPH